MASKEINDIIDNAVARRHGETVRRLDYMWRKLHAAGEIKFELRDNYNDAVGYCIDRYSIDNDDGTVRISRP